ncbi:MAG: flagellar basal body P-ring formation protein FlgA [Alphaproteobacteria bacterium]|nr:flagellar basal body P-ring formation protein FlgA [Alphaproteobacteria bacterium]
MNRALLLIAALAGALPLAAPPASAQTAAAERTVVAARPIRAKAVIDAADLTVTPGATAGALSQPSDAVGMEARVAIYVGWPVRAADLAPPAVVERNALVTLLFTRGGLSIQTDGRALGRAGLGERVRVMNLDSRVTVTGLVTGPNLVEVR